MTIEEYYHHTLFVASGSCESEAAPFQATEREQLVALIDQTALRAGMTRGTVLALPQSNYRELAEYWWEEPPQPRVLLRVGIATDDSRVRVDIMDWGGMKSESGFAAALRADLGNVLKAELEDCRVQEREAYSSQGCFGP